MLFLSQDEVEQLTGYRTKSRQQDFLKGKNINFTTSKNGDVLVLTKAIEQLLMPYSKPDTRATAPNFGAITHG